MASPIDLIVQGGRQMVDARRGFMAAEDEREAMLREQQRAQMARGRPIDIQKITMAIRNIAGGADPNDEAIKLQMGLGEYGSQQPAEPSGGIMPQEAPLPPGAENLAARGGLGMMGGMQPPSMGLSQLQELGTARTPLPQRPSTQMPSQEEALRRGRVATQQMGLGGLGAGVGAETFTAQDLADLQALSQAAAPFVRASTQMSPADRFLLEQLRQAGATARTEAGIRGRAEEGAAGRDLKREQLAERRAEFDRKTTTELMKMDAAMNRARVIAGSALQRAREGNISKEDLAALKAEQSKINALIAAQSKISSSYSELANDPEAQALQASFDERGKSAEASLAEVLKSIKTKRAPGPTAAVPKSNLVRIIRISDGQSKQMTRERAQQYMSQQPGIFRIE